MPEIELTQGFVAVVDEADMAWASSRRWHAAKVRGGAHVYAATKGEGKLDYLHRLVVNAEPGQMVRAKNGNALDCRRANLEIATREAIQRGKRKATNAQSRFRGVTASNRRSKPWRAQIRVRGKLLHLGTHPTEESAAAAYDVAAREHFGAEARLNLTP